ncbi:MAG: Methyltransferase type 11 [Clostridia bacterium]|jgi:ubiquinone/menaquinone biosynthesis C-methylase UbiE|nr:Methyltransferase type 11 [Clostridia bacterium]
MFDKQAVENFYDNYGMKEWERLDATAYGKLLFHNHFEFMKPFIGINKKVLDAGCGPGRFSIEMAKAKCNVTLLDLSSHQLELAKLKCRETDLMSFIDGFIHSSVTDMREINDNTFDIAVCYGAVLNYLHEDTDNAIKELIRVTKNGGTILISVNSRFGVLKGCATELQFPLINFWGKSDLWGIYEVIKTGNEPDYPGAKHPKRHFFNANEILELLNKNNLKDILLGAAPALMTGLRANAEKLYKDKASWETILYTEKSMYLNQNLADNGEFLLARATVMK